MLLGCRKADPHVELKFHSSRWDGHGPNGVAHCEFMLTTDSNEPVFVDVGLPDNLLVWQSIQDGKWNPVDDFHIDENGNRVGHGYTMAYFPTPRSVTKSDPLAIKSDILRCQIEGAVHYRVVIRCSTTSDLHDSAVIFSSEFAFEGR